MKDNKYIYAIRDTDTNKIINAKCGKSGKYYESKKFASIRVNELNTKEKRDRYKLNTFELVLKE